VDQFGQQILPNNHYEGASSTCGRCGSVLRNVLSWKLSTALDMEFCLEALKYALPLGDEHKISTPIRFSSPR